MKILNFIFREQHYKVNQNGSINANGIGFYSNNWKFLGGSSHHWHTRITVPLSEAFNNPEALENCLGWDLDHGTVRQWGGRWGGKLPRIENVYITNE